MTPLLDPRTLTPAQQAALMDDARRRAVAARREAMRSFWSDAARLLGRLRIRLQRAWLAHALRSRGAV